MLLNREYKNPSQMPARIPVFPLAGALLLPRRPMPLNIFEPRYLSMIDDALRGERIIGMLQPTREDDPQTSPSLCAVGCAGRITQFAETGDGRCFIMLMGIARFTVLEELSTTTAYRQFHVDFSSFASDFQEGEGEAAVDRTQLLDALRKFAEANELKIDWSDIEKASNEALVNGLSMMSPYGAKEKQALLEAADLKTRADILVAITQMELARAASSSAQLH